MKSQLPVLKLILFHLRRRFYGIYFLFINRLGMSYEIRSLEMTNLRKYRKRCNVAIDSICQNGNTRHART